jgi:hypothetical protein
LLEPVRAAVKGEEKFEGMFIATTHLSYHGRIIVVCQGLVNRK